MTRLAALCTALCLAAGSLLAEGPFLLVIVGLGGDDAHRQQFHEWAVELVDAAGGRLGLSPDRIIYLSERPERDTARIDGPSRRERVEATLASIGGRMSAEDVLFVVLIGHGSFAGGDSRFNLPGPDLTAADFARLLDTVPARRIVFVNAASSSGGFVEALSAPGRTVITATKTGGERNEPIFAGHFVSALTGADADLDKDGRVSVLEAFTHAQREVAAAYQRDGLILTEHAVLDDNGDGAGTADLTKPATDGIGAGTLFLAARPAASAAADPAIRALEADVRALEEQVATLRATRSGMDDARYAKELERLLVELAVKNRELRERQARAKPPPGGTPR